MVNKLTNKKASYLRKFSYKSDYEKYTGFKLFMVWFVVTLISVASWICVYQLFITFVL